MELAAQLTASPGIGYYPHMKKPTSAREAKALGLKRYFTGKPCKGAGHIADRLASNSTCTECARIAMGAWYIKNKARHLANTNEHKYKRQRAAAGRSMPNHCELCGVHRGPRRLHWDHDHTTGAFRGYLCSECNTGLGKLGDDVPSLERALKYLQGAAKNVR